MRVCRRIITIAVLLTFGTAQLAGTECTFPGPTGPGCSGCRSTSYIVTITQTYTYPDPETGEPVTVTISSDYRLFKLCQDQSMDEGPMPWSSSPTNGNNPEYQSNGLVNCAAAATLYLVPLGQGTCSGTPVAANDPALGGATAAQKDCSTFQRSDGNINWIPATKDCSTGQPWPPPMHTPM